MKKFTDQYINSFEILKHAVVGFEFEFYCDRSYHKLLELLNRELGVKVIGYRVYHSSGEVDETTWKIEPDLSMGPSGIELISGPIPYINAKVYLLKVLKILQRPDFRTDDKCSLHINISFNKDSGKNIDKLNRLKLLLNIDEEFVYKYFPTRENNFYAKSVKKIIPFKSYDFSSDASSLLVNSLEIPDTKYFGVNFLNITDGRLEFRYIGDEEYEKKTGEVLDLLDYFITLTWSCINEEFTDEDMEQLQDYLSENINRFKNFSKLDNFTAEFPTITLQVDKQPSPIILRTYYEQIYDDLYDIITNIYNLNNCIINYDTESTKLEIVDANFKTIFDIKKINIIDSIVDGGSFVNCNFINCDIKNTHMSSCDIIDSDIFNSKIESSKIEYGSLLTDCYLFNSLLNGSMKGGVFRSGKLGDAGELDKNVKIVTSVNNYFGAKIGDASKDKKGLIDIVKMGKQTNKKKFLKGYNTTPDYGTGENDITF